jgi:hypothetical protein
MKLPKNSAACLILALLVPGWAGCKTHTTIAPVSNGYEEVSHPNRTFVLFDEPLAPRVSFQHRDADGTVTLIWPSLYGVSEVVKSDLAIFVGDRAYIEPERVTHPRLFAVRSPDLPLDITDEVLREWSKATGRDYNRAQDNFTLVTPGEKNGRLELRLEFSPADEMSGNRADWPEQSALLLDWNQVEEIMRTVKAKGTEQKDLRWKTPYIGESAKRQ